MADINWRTWLKTKLDAGATGARVGDALIMGAGSIEENVDGRPFIVIKVGSEGRGPFPGSTVRVATIWVHDEPGTYETIDLVLADIKADIEGPVQEAGGVSAVWTGDSVELADEGYRTITRNTTYQLNGKEQANA